MCPSTRFTKIVALVFLLFVLLHCNGSHNARAIWKDAIRKCAENDLLGRDVLFLGPSNNLGPGTVFSEFQSGGTQPSHLTSEYFPNPIPAGLVALGQSFTCKVDSSSSFKFGAGASLEGALPVSGELAVDLEKSKTVRVEATKLQWDQLVLGPYRDLVTTLPAGNSVKEDIINRRNPVLARALRVSGMKAEADFTSEIGADVKAKFPDGTIQGSSGNLNLKWQNDTKLILTSDNDFYIAGELRHYEAGGFAGLGVETEIGPKVTNVEKIIVKKPE